MPNSTDPLAESERQIAAQSVRIKTLSTEIVDEALSLARAARKSRPSTATNLKAVKPGEPLPEGDLTGRFAALTAK